MRELEEHLQATDGHLAGLLENGGLLREEVTPEEIAEVVSK